MSRDDYTAVSLAIYWLSFSFKKFSLSLNKIYPLKARAAPLFPIPPAEGNENSLLLSSKAGRLFHLSGLLCLTSGTSLA